MTERQHGRAAKVVGIGQDGCLGLSARAVAAVDSAHILVGGERHQAFFPQFDGERVVLRKSLRATLAELASRIGEENVCVLASGDPLFFGAGALVVSAFGAQDVEVLPQPSSVQWAFARLGLSWSEADLLSVHGRGLAGLAARLRQSIRAALLTDASDSSPARVARHLLDYGVSQFRVHLCENVAGPDERIRAMSLSELAQCRDAAALSLLVLERRGPVPSTSPYWLEEHFEKRVPKKGLITKREVRQLALANLRLHPRSVVWDVGAGSGSVGIEAALMAPLGRTYAVETNDECVGYCRANARALGADNLEVVHGLAPDVLRDLAAPDAVFVGGSKGEMARIVDVAWEALMPGGRLVINAITLENVHSAHGALRARQLEPEVSLIQVSRGRSLAGMLRYEALNPVHILCAQKPVVEPA